MSLGRAAIYSLRIGRFDIRYSIFILHQRRHVGRQQVKSTIALTLVFIHPRHPWHRSGHEGWRHHDLLLGKRGSVGGGGDRIKDGGGGKVLTCSIFVLSLKNVLVIDTSFLLGMAIRTPHFEHLC